MDYRVNPKSWHTFDSNDVSNNAAQATRYHSPPAVEKSVNPDLCHANGTQLPDFHSLDPELLDSLPTTTSAEALSRIDSNDSDASSRPTPSHVIFTHPDASTYGGQLSNNTDFVADPLLDDASQMPHKTTDLGAKNPPGHQRHLQPLMCHSAKRVDPLWDQAGGSSSTVDSFEKNSRTVQATITIDCAAPETLAAVMDLLVKGKAKGRLETR